MNIERRDTGPACLDQVEAGHRQADAEAAMATAFVDAAMAGDLNELAPWAPLRTEYTRGDGPDFKRLASVGEVLKDSLDYTSGPAVEDVLDLLCAVASGQDQQAQAKALIGRMAQKYAKYRAEADDE